MYYINPEINGTFVLNETYLNGEPSKFGNKYEFHLITPKPSEGIS
jgi:hypothetical protein